MNTLNGAPIIAKTKGAIYLRIPREIAKDIETGCACNYCKAHPELVPQWDALLIPFEPGKRDAMHYASTVHMPEPHIFMEWVKRNRK